jgi:hypothetical protein
MSRSVAAILVVALGSAGGLFARAARAETFILESGGRVEGEIVNPKQSPRQSYVIKTASGGQVTLARGQIKEILRQTEAEAEYDKVRPRYADTVEGQWDLAVWCRDHGLERLRDKHLERVIELDPGHKEAHRLLHHRMDEDGRWKSTKELWESQGYVYYHGDWMTPQEVEIKEHARTTELAVKEWKHRLKRWRDWLGTDRAPEALANINQINDPYAVAAVTEYLAKESDQSVRKRYIEALARIGTGAAWQVLCEVSLRDENEEVRLTCLDYLDDKPSAPVVSYYIKHLKDKQNPVVNRAALGLLRMNDRRAIAPLIDALVTSHKRIIPPSQLGGTSGTFGGMVGGGGGGGMTYGTPKATIVIEHFKNEDVLEALVRLTGGVNFNYEVPTWKSWLASQKKSQSLNARRD